MGSTPLDKIEIARTDQILSRAQIAEIIELTQAAGDADGAYPLSEHVVLHLRHGGETPAVHILARDQERGLLGYAHVDTTDTVEGASAELCVHPLARRRGLGRTLVLEAIEVAGATDPAGRLRLWAHGDHPSANALALSLGFTRWRVLFQLRRSLYAPVAAPELPPGVTLRPFRAGQDEAAWLTLNARAFADLPDQGRWSAEDLRVRMAERWFDPAGFLIAERDGTMVGFHWTKVHGAARHRHGPEGSHDGPDDHQHDPIGEVYVIGVDPSAQGTGLGRALTLAGLRHLREAGLDQVMLYVDETNATAIALYERLGFARWSTDVCFRRTI